MRIHTLAIVFASLLCAIPAFTASSSIGEEATIRETGRIDLRRVETSELPFPEGGFVTGEPLSMEELTFSREPIMPAIGLSVPTATCASLHYQTAAPPKGSDAEKETGFYDYSNGSKLLMPKDTVAGTMTYDSGSPGSSDWIDWYKFSISDIDPSPGAGNGVRNITFRIDSYTDGTLGNPLYEYALTPINSTAYTLSEDYADVIDVQLLYYDPSNGPTYFGGWNFFYDDLDDSDGWSWRTNWTVDYVAPVPSTGPEDPDGSLNGLTEVGWYYVGIALNWYEKNGAPDRGSFDVDYEFSVDASKKQNSDQGANTIETSGDIIPGQAYRSFSRYNNVDWYKVEGEDPGKLWDMSINITRTGAALFNPRPPFYYDPWLHAYMIWHTPGADEKWETSDDDFGGYHFVFSAYFNGALGSMYMIGTAGQWVRVPLENDWFVPDKRMVYLGFYSEPQTIYDNGVDPWSFTYPDWFSLSEYKVDIDIIEESPNRAPVLSKISYSSDWDPDPAGGNLDSTYTFDVTYSDPDNDPPASLFLQIDPDTSGQQEYDLLLGELNKADKTYSDGKDYRFALTGDQLGAGTHDYSVKTSDSIPVSSLRTSILSGPIYRNDTLRVWDDYPVAVDPDWEGIPTISEDDPALDIPLMTQGSVRGPFLDPEDAIKSVRVWDDDAGAWSAEASGDVVTIEIVQDDGLYARIIPFTDLNGHDSFRLMASDDHSSTESTMEVEVGPVNDPPIVWSLERDGKEYTVSLVVDTGIYEADMRDEWVVFEDKKLEFGVKATDNDLSGSLRYAYLDDVSDNWESDPTIDEAGTVTFTPRDPDMKRNMMAFSVSDGVGGTVQLRVQIEIRNTNDPPALSFKIPPKVDYSQGEKVSLRPTGEDPDLDSGDILSYSVNMENDFGNANPSILDQLGLSDIPSSLWSMDLRTGEFFFDLKDQSIWGSGPDRTREETITVAFKVIDLAGASAIRTVELTLSDVNEGPSAPDRIFSDVILDDVDPQTPYLLEYYTVHLWVEPAYDPDGDALTYTWDLGDGKQLQGIDINYTYAAQGIKTLRVWANDGEYDSDPLTGDVTPYTKTILIPPNPDPEFPVYIVVPIAIALLLALSMVLAFFIYKARAKKLAGSAGSVSIPARNKPSTPQYRCPRCGGAVESNWYICPACKSTLQ